MINIKHIEIDESVNSCGTSLMGYVKTDYHELVERFGEPVYGDGDKTTAEWKLEFEADIDGDVDYHVATIYDWKLSDTPMGEYNWHIGGNSFWAVELVEEALKRGK